MELLAKWRDKLSGGQKPDDWRTPTPQTRAKGVGRQTTTQHELRKLVGVETITTVIRSGRLRWYGHVMRKSEGQGEEMCGV